MFGVSVHRLLVHFPIALAFVACGYDAWAVYAREPHLHRTASGLTKLAAVTAMAAAGAGLDLAGMSGLGSASSVAGHAGVALLATLILAVVAGLRYSAEMRADSGQVVFSPGFLAGEAAAVVLVSAAAVMGHRI